MWCPPFSGQDTHIARSAAGRHSFSALPGPAAGVWALSP
jgi:hypothetical protein